MSQYKLFCEKLDKAAVLSHTMPTLSALPGDVISSSSSSGPPPSSPPPCDVMSSSPPPSPSPSPGDGSPCRRLSWGRLVQRLTEFGAGVNNHNHNNNNNTSSTSTSTTSNMQSSNSNDGSRSDLSDSGSDVSACDDDDLFYDPTEEAVLEDVVSLIAHSLREAKDSECALRCAKLLIPEQLLDRIGRELLRLAASEPCGLRGASIVLCVERGGLCESVEHISADPRLVPTFQLTLVLRLEQGGLWPKIQELFGGGVTSSSSKHPLARSAPALKQVVRLGTGFRVIKKKLYSSEELFIEEC
ncbi:hypothetical protein CRUP_000961 [Coryphaenoides rupestris]|nr:hypothetical protein CRUP_000961 [Coryphaenoides rupestris]